MIYIPLNAQLSTTAIVETNTTAFEPQEDLLGPEAASNKNFNDCGRIVGILRSLLKPFEGFEISKNKWSNFFFPKHFTPCFHIAEASPKTAQ